MVVEDTKNGRHAIAVVPRASRLTKKTWFPIFTYLIELSDVKEVILSDGGVWFNIFGGGEMLVSWPKK